MVEERISFLLNDLVREMNSVADAILRSNFDLTYSQFHFLLCLLETGEVDVTRLAEALSVTKGAVSKRIGWFTERGLAETSQLPSDAKRILIRLTPQGEALSRAAGDLLEAKFLATISTSPELNQQVLRSELQKMMQLMQAKRGEAH